nr:homeobox protein VENTX-like [Saimiri boliviensis boliviensis]
MQLLEVQLKTCFQSCWMKHKRQMQDSQLNRPFSGSLQEPPAFYSPSSGLANGLQLLCPWAPLPRIGSGATLWILLGSLPSGIRGPGLCMGFWPWSDSGIPSPSPGSGAHMLGPALSMGPWGLCALPETGDSP